MAGSVWGQHLATLPGPSGDAIRDGMPNQGVHRVVIWGVQRQVCGFVVTHQETLAFEKTAHAVGDGVGQLAQLGAGGCLDPAKPRAGRAIDKVRGQHPIDDAQDLAHDLGPAGEQEAQGKRKA